MGRQHARKGLQREFQDAINQSSARAAGEMRNLSQNIYPDVSQLFGVLLEKMEVFNEYVHAHRNNPDQLQHHFGVKTTGRCLEMIDYENRVLRDRLISIEKIDAFCDTICELSQPNQFYEDMALLCFDQKGRKVASSYLDASKELNLRLRLWQSAATILIEEVENFCVWQNDVLLRDVDESYGAFSDPIAQNGMAAVMKRREEYFSEIKFHHMNNLLLAGDVVATLSDLVKCSGQFAQQAGLISDGAPMFRRGPSLNI